MIISGSTKGLLVISSSTTGMTLRVLNDHKQHAICSLDARGEWWLAASDDQRVSIWRADWSKDACEIEDWVNFAVEKLDRPRKCMARFAPQSADVVYFANLEPNSVVCSLGHGAPLLSPPLVWRGRV